jgi:hypothetical protein
VREATWSGRHDSVLSYVIAQRNQRRQDAVEFWADIPEQGKWRA